MEEINKIYSVVTNKEYTREWNKTTRYGRQTGEKEKRIYKIGTAFKIPNTLERAEKYASKLKKCHKLDVSIIKNYKGNVIYP